MESNEEGVSCEHHVGVLFFVFAFFFVLFFVFNMDDLLRGLIIIWSFSGSYTEFLRESIQSLLVLRFCF